MTAFGKILVFMNLLFSVVTGALIVFVFTTRANWKTAYDDATKKATSAEAAYKAEKNAHDNDIRQKDEANKALQDNMSAAQKSIGDLEKQVADLKRLNQEAGKLNTSETANSLTAQRELNQLRNERDGIVKERDSLKDRIVGLQKEVDKQRELAILADLDARTLRQKNSNLLRQIEDLLVRNRELEQNSLLAGAGTGGDATSVTAPPPRPAPPGVFGKISAVSRSGTNLGQINIGSDSGLSAGNVLVVFRGDVYVGQLTLTEVQAKEAVGKFTPAKARMAMETGDRVATSLSTAGN